jgi:hypothetical protein
MRLPKQQKKTDQAQLERKQEATNQVMFLVQLERENEKELRNIRMKRNYGKFKNKQYTRKQKISLDPPCYLKFTSWGTKWKFLVGAC